MALRMRLAPIQQFGISSAATGRSDDTMRDWRLRKAAMSSQVRMSGDREDPTIGSGSMQLKKVLFNAIGQATGAQRV
jgi:hypothetical protein